MLDGRYPAKAVIEQPVEVTADIVCDSHEVLGAVVLHAAGDDRSWSEVRLTHQGNDHWTAAFTPHQLATHRFTVQAWVDHAATWRRDLQRKADADAVEAVDTQTLSTSDGDG
ncbi:MAG: maltotransferase domain-containing protein, partial [Nitriliruptoraceae bacterium]